MIHKLINSIGNVWKAMGEPMPGLMRFLRHDMPKIILGEKPHIPKADVAVVILSHNYGSMLERAIQSVLAQTIRPIEILVVDDASTDNTRAVAEKFAPKGVSYLRVENRNLSLTRNSGASATSSEFILYLDADDFLPPQYIERCLACMNDAAIGFVYGDIQQFGDWNAFIVSPSFNEAMLTRGNYITSNALLRRQMLDLVGGYNVQPTSFEDWDFLRRCVALGYKGHKAETWVHYNMHQRSLSAVYMQGPHKSYANDAAILQQPLTIFTPFCGRYGVFERYLAGLLSSTIDPQTVQLWWYNTSSDPRFDELLRTTIATLPFASVRYTHDPLPTTWNQTIAALEEGHKTGSVSTEYHYQLAVLRAYNTMIQGCTTDFVLTLEDDSELQPHTIKQMLEHMEYDTAAIIAPYRHKTMDRYEVWMPKEDGTTEHFTQKGSGLQQVGGCGFGCTLFRTEGLRAIAPLYTNIKQTPRQWYDQLSYLRLRRHGRILCDWNLEIAHLQS